MYCTVLKFYVVIKCVTSVKYIAEQKHGNRMQYILSFSFYVDHQGINGGEIFSTRPDRPWGLTSLLYNGYRVILGGKAAGAWR
jgi:hypothetical protein